MAAIAPGTNKSARRKTPKAGAKRDERDTPPDLGYGEAFDENDKDQQKVRDALADEVNRRIREAVSFRETSGIEEEWRDANDLFNGWDDLNAPTNGTMNIRDKNSKAKPDASQGAQSTLVLNITKPKTKVAVARVKEMLVPTNDRPWDMKPTPIPEYEEISTNPKLAGTMVQLGDGSQAPALLAVEAMREKAVQAVKGEADWVEDRFVEGKVYGQMRKVIDDAGRIGTGVLKGPFPICKTSREWKVKGTLAELVLKKKDAPTSKKVRAEDCYPDPSCGEDIHIGSYFVERDFATARELRRLADDPSYDQRAIAQALLEGPENSAMDRATGTKERKKPGDTVRDSSLFTLWYYYGDCTPEALIAMGVEDDELGNTVEAANDAPYSGNKARSADDEAEQAFDPGKARGKLSDEEKAALRTVPSMVTMLNGRPIKAVISPLESGEFPFDFFPWEPVEGQPWGRGVPMEMKAAQLIVKSGVRRMLENGGLSAGPQIAITEGALTPYDNVYQITGRKLWKFTPTQLISDINKAMAMFEIPSMQVELMNIITFGLEMADRLTNIPMLLQGDQQAGTSPETLGGMKLLVQNSMAPLRDKAKLYDDNLIGPHLTRYHEWFMLHVPDKPKGDTEIKPLGSTALVQREEGREFLMMLAPVKDDPKYRINPDKFARELARGNGYDIALIQYTEEEWKTAPENPANAQPAEPYQVTVAKINAKVNTDTAGAKHQLGMTAEQARMTHENEDRQLRVKELELKAEELKNTKDIAMLNYAAKMGVNLEQVKKDLAIAAGQEESRRQEMQLKLSPENPTHTGI